MRQKHYLFVVLVMFLALHTTGMFAGNKVVRKVNTYNYKDFTSLRISGFPKVYFTQGNNYSIRVEESTSPHVKTIVKKNGQILTIETKSLKKNLSNVDAPVVRITAPMLNAIHSSGAVSLNAMMSSLKTSQLDISTSGASKVFLKEVTCNSMKIACSGASSMNLGVVRCPSIKINGSGANKLKMSIVGNENTSMMFSGASKGEINYQGDSLQISSSGAGKLDIKVDCKYLKAYNSGAAKMTISGTADHTEIKSSGASKINTSELNKY